MSRRSALLAAATLAMLVAAGCSKRATWFASARQALSGPTSASSPYSLRTLGALSCKALNASGWVLGNSARNTALLIAPDGTVNEISLPPGDPMVSAVGINNSLIVAGNGSAVDQFGLPASPHAVVYDGEWTPLGFLGTGTVSAAAGINDSGQIVGWGSVDSTNNSQQAFFYNGQMHALAGLGFGATTARAISRGGQIAGTIDIPDGTPFGHTHAALWANPGATPTDLGSLGGLHSAAFAINQSSVVVGVSDLSDGSTIHAFLYNGSMTDLGTLPGDARSLAYGISAAGTVVGTSLGTSGEGRAFAYRAGAFIDLSALTTSDGKQFRGTQALAINDNDTIIGQGTSSDGKLNCLVWSVQ
jgi:probable HAF family extracellular repeat protein